MQAKTMEAMVAIEDEDAPAEWPAAFVALYRARYVPMVKLGYLLVGSNSVAEEIVQDAFVRVRIAIDRVDHPEAYLRAAVVNACRNHLRHVAVERRHFRPSLEGQDAADDYLADALVRLPPRQRAVIVLRYYEQMSEREIADVLQCRPGTVKSAAARALAELRKAFDS